MPHYSRLCKVVIDVGSDDRAAEAAFWENALGSPMELVDGAPEYTGMVVHSPRMWLLVQELDDRPSRPRIHLDIHTDDVEAEVARLEALGARRACRVHSWWVMLDPAGIPFCVIPCPPGSLNDRTARQWE
jgi:hypothetical protein